jgi:hypothetical protein
MSASFDDGPRFEARGVAIISLLRMVRDGAAVRLESGVRLNEAEQEVLRALRAAHGAVMCAELPDFRAGSDETEDSVTIEYVTTAQAAVLLERSPRRIRQLAVDEERLGFRRVGGRVEVVLADVERLREERAR